MAASKIVLILLLAIIPALLAQGEASQEDELDLDRPLYASRIIDLVNSDPNAGWVAGVNEKFINYTLRDFKSMGGAIFEPSLMMNSSSSTIHDALKQFPTFFDARQYWNCPSMWRILDQGTCGACWAFSSVQTLTDRFCTYYGMDLFLSVEDVLSFCTSCGSCDAGYLQRAFEYLYNRGTVTWQCSPYFDTTACPTHGCKGVDTPQCIRGCSSPYENWNQRYRAARPPYQIYGIENIMSEIMTYGPVSAGLQAYEDLSTYKTGIYRHLQGEFIINHFVKLVGWGVSPQGQAYWLATNQWGRNWGEGGHFKIAMGINECGIENYVMATTPEPTNEIISVA